MATLAAATTTLLLLLLMALGLYPLFATVDYSAEKMWENGTECVSDPVRKQQYVVMALPKAQSIL